MLKNHHIDHLQGHVIARLLIQPGLEDERLYRMLAGSETPAITEGPLPRWSGAAAEQGSYSERFEDEVGKACEGSSARQAARRMSLAGVAVPTSPVYETPSTNSASL